MRILLRGVQPAGCADAEEFDGEYILDLLESRAEQCRRELTLSPKCHLYRICLVALPADGQSVELRAFFEGSYAAPRWKRSIDSATFAPVTLEFDDSRATNPVAGCLWPRTIEVEAIGEAPPGRFKIPAAPTKAEQATMASTCNAFNCAPAQAGPYEIAVQVTSGSAESVAFQAVTRVTLIAPTQAPTALQYIQVGWIQKRLPIGRSTYGTTPAGGYRRIYRATIQCLDGLRTPCSPMDDDLWPWYANDPNVWATGEGSGTWQKVLGMNDSPGILIPSFYNQTDPNEPNRAAVLQDFAVTGQYTLRMAARTKDNNLNASDHYFSIGRAYWQVDCAWPVVSGRSTTYSQATRLTLITCLR